MKPITVIKKGAEGYLYINGIPYVPIIDHKKDYTEFCPVDKKEIENMVNKITPLLLNHIDKERVIRGALMNTPVDNLAVIFKKLFDQTRKRKTNIKQKDGCLYLSIGGARLDIQD